MEERNIIEGNKLIAEFMGCHGASMWVGGEKVYRYGFNGTHITDRWHESQFDERTPYHSSWDWLMPALKKYGDMPSNPQQKNHWSNIAEIGLASIEIGVTWRLFINALIDYNSSTGIPLTSK